MEPLKSNSYLSICEVGTPTSRNDALGKGETKNNEINYLFSIHITNNYSLNIFNLSKAMALSMCQNCIYPTKIPLMDLDSTNVKLCH